jgi:hypothetical protein
MRSVSEGLKFSDEQKEKLKALNEDLRKKAEAARQEAGRDRQKLRELTGKVADEGLEQFQKQLNAGQKKKWEDLYGKPFTVRIERQ